MVTFNYIITNPNLMMVNFIPFNQDTHIPNSMFFCTSLPDCCFFWIWNIY